MDKKGFGIFLFVIVLFSLASAFTGEVITGEASEGPTDVSVFVEPGPPIIYIYSPLNITYQGTDFILNYSIRNDLNQSWYNIDNGVNVSLGSLKDNSLALNSTLGVHTLYIYAYNSLGESSKNVSFTLSQEPPPGSSSSSSSSSGGSSSGGGGGSSGGGASSPSFELDKKIIQISLIQGESKKDNFIIKNLARRDIILRIETEDLENLVILDEKEITLGPLESQEVEITFFSLSTFPQGIYVGKINVFEGNKKESIVAIIEIKQRAALFDVGVEILKRDKESSPGDEISAIIEMTNIGLRGTAVDVELSLSIVDLKKEIVKEYSKETLAIRDDTTVNKKLKLPEDIKYGTYLLVADLSYLNISASSYDSFEIKGNTVNWLFIISLIILIISTLMLIKVLTKSKQLKKKRR